MNAFLAEELKKRGEYNMRRGTKREREQIRKRYMNLSDHELVAKYYRLVNDSLGSSCDRMYDLGYDLCDIEEQRKLEEYKRIECAVVEQMCIERGIEL